jgi:hypothetical protein
LKVPILFSQHEHRILTGQKPYFKRVLPLFSKPYLDCRLEIEKLTISSQIPFPVAPCEPQVNRVNLGQQLLQVFSER